MPKNGLKRKDAGVVDRGGLENRCTLTGTKGSNPFLSAGNVKPKGDKTGQENAMFTFEKHLKIDLGYYKKLKYVLSPLLQPFRNNQNTNIIASIKS